MKFLRNTFAFLLIPAICAAGYTLVKKFLYFTVSAGSLYVPFWIGILCYIVFQIVFYKPMRTYIFGHELSHAIAGILSGAKIKKFKLGAESGSVVLTEDNIWITLAPYFFPIYTIAIIGIYVLLGWFTDIKQFYSYYLFLIGFSISFHIALTMYILSIEQPDLKVYGTFFSYIAILTVNIIAFALIASSAFVDDIDIKDVWLHAYDNILKIYKFLYIGVLEIWLTFQKTR
ncbi:MAG: hypothetical protein LE180_00770 [Endomicrobium sp.]|uniref:hypothetical protein n=1 Tax=Candidatus Endomicrobiellum pyrsonymphae TaxID=1408203 RepID=UPI003575EA21|nr:hypothetical protein [Endomicrobium sp.]